MLQSIVRERVRDRIDTVERRLRDPLPALRNLTRIAMEGNEAGAEAAPRGGTSPPRLTCVLCRVDMSIAERSSFFGRLARPHFALGHAEAAIGRGHGGIGVGVRLESDQSRGVVLLAPFLPGLHLRFSGDNLLGVLRRGRVATA